jgi:Spondin_N
MKRTSALLAGLIVVSGLLAGRTSAAQEHEPRFAVTVTNLTRGQTFTPVLVASHREGVRLFTLGKAASPELATLAEERAPAPLAALLLATPGVHDVANTGAPPAGFVGPGQSRTIVVDAGRGADHVSVAAMLIPTNDAFFALNGWRRRREARSSRTSRRPMTRAASATTSSARVSLVRASPNAVGRAVADTRRAARRGTSTSTQAFTGSATSTPVFGTGATRSPKSRSGGSVRHHRRPRAGS